MPITQYPDHALVRRAYASLEQAPAPYRRHAEGVASLLADLHFDPTIVAAGLLHDVLTLDLLTPDQLRADFGGDIADLVEGVTRLEQLTRHVGQGEATVRDTQELISFRKLLTTLAEENRWVLSIKLADQLDFMLSLEEAGLSPEMQKRVAHETMEVYAPPANRLGIWRLKSELEDIAFRYLNPEMYHELAQLVDARKEERERRVRQHRQILAQALVEEGIDHAVIKGRPKHLYSIYSKMQRKGVPFAQIYDVEGMRVLVETEWQCYRTLAVTHRLWEPIPDEFDNYIANPKPNGYQSLHTAVIGEDGRPLEIQIRTHEMHRLAEYGVAAHWRYKESGTPLDRQTVIQVARMRGAPPDAVSQEDLPAEQAPATIYVLTPKGNIFELPRGATPIDFAYRVHTEIGHDCRGAKVNGEWVSLDYKLQMGDEVEIVTGRKGGPSRDWLNEEAGFVVTSRARQKIRQWFRKQGREENIAQGRSIVEQVLKRLGADLTLVEVADLFTKRYPRRDDFFNAVGMGDVKAPRVENSVRSFLAQRAAETPPETQVEPEIEQPDLTKTSAQIYVGDLSAKTDLLTRIAGCCNPLPGDAIVGYVTRGRGVTIHRRDCHNIRKMDAADRERLIDVSWGAKTDNLLAEVIVKAYHSARLLQDISAIIEEDERVNIHAIQKGRLDRDDVLPLYITLEVPNLEALEAILERLERIPKVIHARRRVAG
ncbi:MAG: RelA/SpoT family protein [Anaerolineae bacterium]